MTSLELSCSRGAVPVRTGPVWLDVFGGSCRRRRRVAPGMRPAQPCRVRLLSWNLLRHRGATVADLERMIAAHAPDLLLMQEATDPIDALPGAVGGHYVRAVMPHRSHGLAAWSPRPFSATEHPLPRGGRLDLPPPVWRTMTPRLALVVRTGSLVVATVHLDHGQIANRRQLRALVRAAPDIALVIGDFNALGPAVLASFEDVGPVTWTHRAWGVLPLRLDRCLVRHRRSVDAIALDPGPSDHRPIRLDLAPSLA